ncbi:MAG: hypothetical protein V7603_4107, partial [Micromonosporaceae bacterium]
GGHPVVPTNGVFRSGSMIGVPPWAAPAAIAPPRAAATGVLRPVPSWTSRPLPRLPPADRSVEPVSSRPAASSRSIRSAGRNAPDRSAGSNGSSLRAGAAQVCGANRAHGPRVPCGPAELLASRRPGAMAHLGWGARPGSRALPGPTAAWEPAAPRGWRALRGWRRRLARGGRNRVPDRWVVATQRTPRARMVPIVRTAPAVQTGLAVRASVGSRERYAPPASTAPKSRAVPSR